ncbi:hypothetical protein ACMU_11095 [Actibacterium mucosum KCTC 23349]|uniref:3-hydroxyisobutyrate dehydrogenase n=1 Tax=Actibacterium mucosum KCTC 23349 TaxID=1454373 RepID=A0A037ZKY7_9RHOB|nr:NAD(P)-dependent oxidoreductase [Actibacterium mucosum]KAJ56289.1 hypothetical protein ACMU_11095 [Actibacterium mucosum KCTC 23349]
MTKIAFLGLGAMGSRMAGNLLASGHEVTVWNRNRDRADALGNAGAVVAESPAIAAKGAEIVISMVRDDRASHAVWAAPESGAFAGMSPGTLGVECSTVSPGHAKALHNIAASRGVGFLDAPLAGSRPQAEAAQLIFMVGGMESDLGKAQPVLNDMGSAVHHAGDAGAGAVVKLMVNTLFAAQLATLAELLGLASSGGLAPARALEILSATPVASPAAKLGGSAMLAQAFQPAFPIELVCKDLGLALDTNEEGGQAAPMTQATAEVFAKAADSGFGADNITAIAKLYAPFG